MGIEKGIEKKRDRPNTNPSAEGWLGNYGLGLVQRRRRTRYQLTFRNISERNCYLRGHDRDSRGPAVHGHWEVLVTAVWKEARSFNKRERVEA